MLVLSRRVGERIYIGENIVVTLVDIDRGKVRIGIQAPRDVPVFRQELIEPEVWLKEEAERKTKK